MAEHSTKSSRNDPSLKTRHFADIVQEITRSMAIHHAKGTILGGVHLELTGEINQDGFSVVSDDFQVSLNTDRVYWRLHGAGR